MICKYISQHFNDFYFGGNWTGSCLRETLEGVNVEEANQKVGDLNSILALTYHIGYFMTAMLAVLDGKELAAHDKFSYDHPQLSSEDEWTLFKEKEFETAKKVIKHLENLGDETLSSIFEQEKYGTYFRKINGTLEHNHYHLGQIAILKKLIKSA